MAKSLVAALAGILVATLLGGTSSSWAEACEGINCSEPTPVGKGKKAPLWHVVQCVIGPEGGPYTPIACDDPKAVHMSPRGMESVCFLGSDGKIHWDLPGIVHEGRTFKNIRQGGVWQPLWELTRAEKDRLGIK